MGFLPLSLTFSMSNPIPFSAHEQRISDDIRFLRALQKLAECWGAQLIVDGFHFSSLCDDAEA